MATTNKQTNKKTTSVGKAVEKLGPSYTVGGICVLRCLVMSDSVAPGTEALQAPSVHGIFQARTL